MRTFFWRQEVFREFAWLFHRGNPAESWGYLSKTHCWPNSGESSDPLHLITSRCRYCTGNVGEKRGRGKQRGAISFRGEDALALRCRAGSSLGTLAARRTNPVGLFWLGFGFLFVCFWFFLFYFKTCPLFCSGVLRSTNPPRSPGGTTSPAAARTAPPAARSPLGAPQPPPAEGLPFPSGTEGFHRRAALPHARPPPRAGRGLPAPHRGWTRGLPGSGAGQPRARGLVPGGRREGGRRGGFNPGFHQGNP